MHLARVDFHDVRNFAQLRLDLPQGTVLLTGDNGSGKTSFLEGVWLLATGRSFRSSRVSSMIRNEAARLTVFGELQSAEGGSVRLGIQRDRQGDGEVRIDGQVQSTASALAEQLPVQLLHPESVEIVTGSPGRRRQFVDWGTFHVEQSDRSLWRNFRRALDQRNALLRSRGASPSEFDLWEARLVEAAERLDAARRQHVQVLAEALPEALDALGGEVDLQIDYTAGWDRDRPLGDLLAASRGSDREAGYTRVGPQRGDLRMIAQGRRAAEVLSRGQQKVLACALLIAQGRVVHGVGDREPVVLVDDLPAELDRDRRDRLGAVLGSFEGQVLVTAVQRDLVESGLARGGPLSVFHVEQQQIRPA